MTKPPFGESFLYHQRPKHFIGATLYPLRMLETIAPATYADAVTKYDDHPDRLGLPLTPIPILACAWRDVVQCSPIHPNALYQAQCDAGIAPRPQSFFTIPLDRVRHLPAVVFVRDANRTPMYEPVEWSTYAELQAVPDVTRDWYRRLADRGRRGAAFVGVPHLMIQGPINIAGCPVIDWSEPF